MADRKRPTFRPPFDEEQKARVWRRIRAESRATTRPARTKAFLWVAAAILLVAAGVVASPWVRDTLSPPVLPPPVLPPPSASVASNPPHAAATIPAPTPVEDASVEDAAGATAPVSASALARQAERDAAVARWLALEAEGAHARAYDELGPGGVGVATRGASLDELFALADVARLSGHPREATEPLERIVREFPDDKRTSLAAFTLGRLYLGTMNDPAKAAWAFQRAIDLGVPGGLEEDAYAGLVEADARRGDLDAARAAYATATKRFPSGRRSVEMQRWVDPK